MASETETMPQEYFTWNWDAVRPQVFSLYSAGLGGWTMDGIVVRHSHPNVGHDAEAHLCTGAYSGRDILHFTTRDQAEREARKYVHPESGRHPVVIRHVLEPGIYGTLEPDKTSPLPIPAAPHPALWPCPHCYGTSVNPAHTPPLTGTPRA